MKTTEIGELIKDAMRRQADDLNYEGVEALADLSVDTFIARVIEFDEYRSIGRVYEALKKERYGEVKPGEPDPMDKVHAEIEENMR